MLRPLVYLCVLIALTGAVDVCTLTGPTVIDFKANLNNVTDRCAYSLIADSHSGFQLFANFRERRRRDVSFVDSVALKLDVPDVNIVLEQGGRVLVNDVVVSINSTARDFHGVDISKTESGVTAEFSVSTISISVFFDGTTAQINTQNSNSSWTGLCVDSRDVPGEKLSDYSSSSCELQYTDDTDSCNNCTTVTEHCNILTKHTFASCNVDLDPTPYINACKETMCRYPTEDGLITQFLWAYARACSLNGHNQLGDWWTKAECSPPKAYCQDVICSDHEFCGWKFSGEPACLCRALFGYKYRKSDTLGEPTVCEDNSAVLTLANCLLEERGIDHEVLHLYDPTCKGKLNENNMVTFKFDTSNLCGAEITSDVKDINYTNAIINQNFTADIVRHDQVFIEFSCFHRQPDLRTVSFTIMDNSYVIRVKSGEWTYNVSMIPYIDEKCTKVVATDTEVKLNQKVWVELKTQGLDADTIAVVTDSCWATSVSDAYSTPRHDLIIDGCANPDDGTVRVRGNGVGTSNRFSFNMFEFRLHPRHVHLHCQLRLCLKENNNCVPTCPPSKRRRRFARSKYTQDEPALISMGWRK
ncbi:alpha-tectorin [Kryptolebias marmoratus]|uniref:alpha-tectorin n=1 Tax=Kryptolebias marmoratus TaxID=37003 RepID=UPI0007F902D2|nr:alpha-tectorin [Kryptolebias marmoratus]